MASKQTYECYVCKRNGFADIRVYLDGKTEDGKTIYRNEDMLPHVHKQAKQQQSQPQQQSSIIVTEPTSLKIINAKLDRIIALLLESQQQERATANDYRGKGCRRD